MQIKPRYTIFRTKWGYFGLAANKKGLLSTHLPTKDREALERRLLKDLPDARFDNDLLKSLQQQITTYFEGNCADFSRVPVILDGLMPFTRRILAICREVGFGRTITYGHLAQKAGKPNAARAVGNALARNPLPLIIPCHRVIRADGKPGGFSAAAGTRLKRKMLCLEQ